MQAEKGTDKLGTKVVNSLKKEVSNPHLVPLPHKGMYSLCLLIKQWGYLSRMGGQAEHSISTCSFFLPANLVQR